MSTDTAEGRIRSASARFASYHPKTGLNAKGKKAPAALSVAKSSKAVADTAPRIKRKAERTEAEHRAFLDHRNDLLHATRDRRNAVRRAKRAELKAERGETPEQYRARLSAVAKERGDRQRAERGDTCVNGHPVSNLGGECFECRRARQPRVNEMRRLADAAKRRLADFGLTMVGSLPIRVGRQFESGRKLGKTHQNVVVFVKGSPQKATRAIAKVAA